MPKSEKATQLKYKTKYQIIKCNKFDQYCKKVRAIEDDGNQKNSM